MTRRSDFRKALNDVLRSAERSQREAVVALFAIIRSLRAQIADRITRGEITAASSPALLRDIDAMIAQATEEMGASASTSIFAAGSLGADSVLNPLRAIGAGAPSVSQLQRIRQLAGFTVELIVGGLSDTMRNRIRRAVTMNALGDAAPSVAMADIDIVLGLVGRGGRTKTTGIFYDAERIIRTETGRAFNMAANDTLQAAADDDPNVKKRWINALQPTSRPEHVAVHVATLSNPIPANEPFMVGGEALMFPQDPNGSAGNTINCGCRMVTVYDDIGVIELHNERGRIEAIGT